MRNIKSIIALLLIAFVSAGMSGQTLNKLSVSSAMLQKGGKTTLSVSMENVAPVVAVQMTIKTPNGVDINPVSATLTERAADHTITCRTMPDGSCLMVIMSGTNSSFKSFIGELATFEVRSSSESIAEQDYPVVVSNAVMSAKDGSNIMQECENGVVTIASLPNLHVTSVECSDPIASYPVNITWTVKNDGRGTTHTTQWKDYVWMISDVKGGTGMSGSRLLATVDNIQALDPQESYTNSVRVTLPARVYGNYDIVVLSDMRDATNVNLPYANTSAAYNLVEEEDETRTYSDNIGYKSIEIAVPPLPDLQVTGVGVTVDNTISTNADPSPLQQAGLASSDMFYSGKNVKVTARVKNNGTLAVSNARIQNILYMSAQGDSHGSGLIRLSSTQSTVTLDRGEETYIEFTGQIPYDWAGDTYFFVHIDANESIYEYANTENNWGVSSCVNVLVTPGADFVVRSVTVPSEIAAGAAFDVSYKIENIGPGVPYVTRWYDAIYASSKSTGLDASATLLGKVTRTGTYKKDGDKYVFDGDTYSATKSVALPASWRGKYYIYVKVDADNNVKEYDGEDDNVGCSSPVTVVLADLKPELLSVSPEAVETGEDMYLSWKVLNCGETSVQNISLTDQFFASANTNGSNPIALGTASNVVSVAEGGEKCFKATISVPANTELNGDMYVFVKTNSNGSVAESDMSNNLSNALPCHFKYLSPEERPVVKGTNLTVSALTIETFDRESSKVSVRYKVANTGTLPVENLAALTQELFVSKNSSFDASSATLLTTDIAWPVASLAKGASTECTASFKIPAGLMGGANTLYAAVNRDKRLAEARTTDNVARQSITLSGNLPDIVVSNVSAPEKVYTAKAITVSWTMANNGEWESLSAITCGVYVSDDNSYSGNDRLLATVQARPMKVGESMEMKASVKVPDGVTGTKYFIVRADVKSTLEELAVDNNTGYCETFSIQTPMPRPVPEIDPIPNKPHPGGDVIDVTGFVKNDGEGETRENQQSVTFYLCEDFDFDITKAVKIGGHTHTGTLESGDSYKFSTQLKLPTDLPTGYYLLIMVTKDGEITYGGSGANGLTDYQRVYVKCPADTPAELSVRKVSAPASIIAGEEINISYSISNTGTYAAEGNLRDVIYMSKDEILDASDPIIGVVQGRVNMEPGEEIVRSATGCVTNVISGDYYIIVKTNSTRTIAETSYDNNWTAQPMVTNVDFARLPLGSTQSVNTAGLYKVTVADGSEGKTLGFELSHPEEANAGLYVAHESVPTTAKYDRHSSVLLTGKQEVLIPNIKSGTYYILAQDNSRIGLDTQAFVLDGEDVAAKPNGTQMMLSAEELKFGATSLSLKEGGTGGWVTTDIKGALLDTIMDFRLINDAEVIPVEVLTFHDQTSTTSTFNLNKAKTGVYDVVSELPDGSLASIDNAFTVVPGAASGLSVKINAPGVVRSGSYAPITIVYANGGNTDITIREIMVVIDYGALSTTIDGLDAGEKVMHIVPEGGKNRLGYAVIPPGTQKTINCYMLQKAATSHLKIYTVK